MAQIEQLLRNLPPVSPAVPGRTTTTVAPGAGASSGPAHLAAGPATTSPATTSPGPTTTTPTPAPPLGTASGSAGDMNGVQTYAVGQSGTLWDPDLMVPLATITVSAPQLATRDGAGDVPQYGYFAIFTVTVDDIAPGSSGDTVAPSDSDYYVLVDGRAYGFGQTNPGKTIQAEGNDYLGNDVDPGGLDPGQSATGTVTVDVPGQHGLLVYAPDGTPLGTWSF